MPWSSPPLVVLASLVLAWVLAGLAGRLRGTWDPMGLVVRTPATDGG